MNKLRAIWMILRAKAWFCMTMDSESETTYSYDVSRICTDGRKAKGFEALANAHEAVKYLRDCLRDVAEKIYPPKNIFQTLGKPSPLPGKTKQK